MENDRRLKLMADKGLLFSLNGMYMNIAQSSDVGLHVDIPGLRWFVSVSSNNFPDKVSKQALFSPCRLLSNYQ
jgi:hypothetical protein